MHRVQTVQPNNNNDDDDDNDDDRICLRTSNEEIMSYLSQDGRMRSANFTRVIPTVLPYDVCNKHQVGLNEGKVTGHISSQHASITTTGTHKRIVGCDRNAR